jgi:hypothetical protein
MQPLLLDTSALLAVGRVIWLSRLLAAAHHRTDVPLLVPAMSVVELAYHHLLMFDRWQWPQPDVAHVASIAFPSAEHPDGVPVVTADPGRYGHWHHVRTLPLDN